VKIIALLQRLPPSQRFTLLAAQNFALNLGLTAALTEGLGLPPAWAFGITLVVMTALQFVLLRYVVFPSRHRAWPAQLAEFLASIAAFRLLEYAAFVLVYESLGLHYLLTITGILMVSFLGKFLLYRFRVFPAPKTVDGTADERG
jgi:putative flippase GtrA